MPTPCESTLLEEKLTRSVIRTLFDVHNELGFGYREHVYALAIEKDLIAKGHRVEREVSVVIHFRGEPLTWQTLDMLVDRKLVVEIKATERLHPDARRQLFSYLRATKLEVGLLLHIGIEPKFSRVVCENRLKAHATSAPTLDPPLP